MRREERIEFYCKRGIGTEEQETKERISISQILILREKEIQRERR